MSQIGKPERIRRIKEQPPAPLRQAPAEQPAEQPKEPVPV